MGSSAWMRCIGAGALAACWLYAPAPASAQGLFDRLREQIQPTTLTLRDLDLTLERTEDGALRLAGGPGVELFSGPGRETSTPSLETVLAAALGGAMAGMGSFEEVTVQDSTFAFVDLRTGDRWQAAGASAVIRRINEVDLSATVRGQVTGPGGGDAPVAASLSHNAAIGETRLSLEFEGARPADLAAQVDVLAGLALVDAPVSGALAAIFRDDGTFLSFNGRLAMAAGVVEPLPGRRIDFERADVYFDYEPDSDAFAIQRLEVATAYGSAIGDGVVQVGRDPAGNAAAFDGQMRIARASVAVNGEDSARLEFAGGEALLRVALDPFEITIGRVLVADGPRRAELSGRISVLPDRWDVILDASGTEVPARDVLAGWPGWIRPGLRAWLDGAIKDGVLERIEASFRQIGGQQRGGIDYRFRDGVAEVLEGFPLIRGATGQGQFFGGRFDSTFDAGHITAPGGAAVDLAGSELEITDARQSPTMLDIRLAGRGRIPDALGVLNQPPLNLVSHPLQARDALRGGAEATARIRLPLLNDIRGTDVDVVATARLTNLSSDVLVPGFRAEASHMRFLSRKGGVEVRGPVTLTGVPMDVVVSRTVGQASTRVTGTMAVTDATARGLGIPLPAGALRGTGQAAFEVEVPEAASATYSADLALAGNRLRIEPLGWTKPAGPSARLQISGLLGAETTVDALRLTGPGLEIEGRLDLGETGIAGGDFSRLALRPWLDAPVRWDLSGGEVAIDGGRIDLREGLPPSDGSGGVRYRLSPDEVVLSETLRLTDLQGVVEPGALPQGRFTAKVNGQAPIKGYIRDRGDVFMTGADGGAVLRAAGILDNVVGGTLRVSAVPPVPGGAPLGGVFSLKEARVRDAPVLAEILSGLLIFTLVERLAGPGIPFNDAQGKWSISDGVLEIDTARATGTGLGLTLEGRYDTERDRLDMRGVLTPAFAINGAFQRIAGIGRLIGGRPGEGVIGARFRLTGAASDPKIGLNPLSLLTPGAAREIFGQGAQE